MSLNLDIVAQSLQMAEVDPHQSCESEISALKHQLQVERENVAHERNLRSNYRNRQCRIKKEWQLRNTQLREEMENLRKEKESVENDCNFFERMLAERDKKINQMQVEIGKLFDHINAVKAQLSNLM